MIKVDYKLDRTTLSIEQTKTDKAVCAEWLVATIINAFGNEKLTYRQHLFFKNIRQAFELSAEEFVELSEEQFFFLREALASTSYDAKVNELVCQLYNKFNLGE